MSRSVWSQATEPSGPILRKYSSSPFRLLRFEPAVFDALSLWLGFLELPCDLDVDPRGTSLRESLLRALGESLKKLEQRS